MKKIAAGALMLISVAGAAANTPGGWNKPYEASQNRAPLRSEFISYDAREDAEREARLDATYYLPLYLFSTDNVGKPQYGSIAQIPYLWLDRDVFIHIEGVPEFSLEVNGHKVGHSQDSKTPSEFNITEYITNGRNALVMNVDQTGNGAAMEKLTEDGGYVMDNVYLYGQPKVRIENYRVDLRPDLTQKFGMLNLEIAVANSYNGPESFTVGYDIFSPEGALVYYDMREVRVQGHARDTVRFKEPIYDGIMKKLWSAENPKQYHMMVFVKRDGRLIEYIPFSSGFGTTELAEGAILRNGKPIDMKVARYNSDPDRATTFDQLGQIRRGGVNTIWVDYPQPYWFYDQCTELGLYVIDQANNNSDPAGGNRNIGGARSNDPRYVDYFTQRAEAMYERSRNHVCIIGWSVGGMSGNGYNTQKAYEVLKSKGDSRPVIYMDADGEWNSDFIIPAPIDGMTLISPAEK